MDYTVTLEQAKQLIEVQKPHASAQHKAAFANSVAYFVTGMSGGYGGPSVREHAAARLKAKQYEWTYEQAVEALNSDDGPIFGPLNDTHRWCWGHERCFDDDPSDVAKL